MEMLAASNKSVVSRLLLFSTCVAIATWLAFGVGTLLHLALADRESMAQSLALISLEEESFTQSPSYDDRQYSSTNDIVDSIRSEFDAGLTYNTVVIAFGIVFGIIALSLPKYREFLTLTSSLTYWLFWYHFGFPTSISFIDAYSLKWEAAKTLDSIGNFFLIDIAAPLFFGFAICISFISLLVRSKTVRAIFSAAGPA